MNARSFVPLAGTALLLAGFAPAPGAAVREPSAAFWNGTGHMVVARIAWDHMTPLARSRAVALLRMAPGDAHVCDLGPTGTATTQARRNCFVQAATWPDRARGTDRDHPSWHFLDTYWRMGPGGTPEEVNQPRAPVNAVSRLQQMKDSVADVAVRDTTRAMQLAWIEHLVGDIHQPLHTSSQVTATDPLPDGDRGGNRFALAGRPNNLHSWWDGALDRQFPRTSGEQASDFAYTTRIAKTLQSGSPAPVAVPDPFGFDSWLKEGMQSARTAVYVGVTPHASPNGAYRTKTSSIADPAVVRAALRLAAMLNTLFDPAFH
jgi:hypothetical protein